MSSILVHISFVASTAEAGENASTLLSMKSNKSAELILKAKYPDSPSFRGQYCTAKYMDSNLTITNSSDFYSQHSTS